LCVKLFDLISVGVKKALNCLRTKKVCKPVAELQRELEAILIHRLLPAQNELAPTGNWNKSAHRYAIAPGESLI